MSATTEFDQLYTKQPTDPVSMEVAAKSLSEGDVVLWGRLWRTVTDIRFTDKRHFMRITFDDRTTKRVVATASVHKLLADANS